MPAKKKREKKRAKQRKAKKKPFKKKPTPPVLVQKLHNKIETGSIREMEKNKATEDYTVIIPAYNEAENLPHLLESLRVITKNVVLVDDGSTDRTAKIGKRFGLTVIKHGKNKGKGAAIATGLRASKTEKVVLMDADNQHSPYELPILLEKLRDADLVLGNRFQKSQAMPLHRRIANKLIITLASLKADLKDPLCGFRALRKSKFNLNEHSFNADLELVFDAVDAGLEIKHVPVSVKYDIEEKQSSKTSNIPNAVKEYTGLVLYTVKWLAGLK